MKSLMNISRVMIAAGALSLASAALAQSAAGTSAPPASPAPNAGVAPSAASGKRSACQTSAQGMKGQERQDQMQLCMAQAHLDCLKQAIDQKVVGPQRKDFMKSCMGGGA
jgi:Spy/CpxP family protein refolding chaperone